jgi:hypothetical protein
MHEWGTSVLARGAYVKVADYSDPSSTGTLTHVKLIEYVCECVFATDYA